MSAATVKATALRRSEWSTSQSKGFELNRKDLRTGLFLLETSGNQVFSPCFPPKFRCFYDSWVLVSPVHFLHTKSLILTSGDSCNFPLPLLQSHDCFPASSNIFLSKNWQIFLRIKAAKRSSVDGCHLHFCCANHISIYPHC